MDRLPRTETQEQRDERHDALTPEQRKTYARLTEEEAYLHRTIAELDECAKMLGPHSADATHLVKTGLDYLRRALCEVADTAHDMLCD